ncbi:chromate efflux transporter [Rhodobacteraceae bacterium M382]|nr:chromate efflux transporter [Rhodobacteraceae bacterium M382]
MTSPTDLTFRELFRVFWRIGILSFGGPAAQIAVMHKELVVDRPWLSEEAFLRALSFCMLLPGPEAMQLATYAGWRLKGVAGGLLAGALFVLPGACVIAALVAVYAQFGEVPGVQAAFLGVKATVIAIVIQALTRLAKKTLHGWQGILLAGLAFVGIYALKLPFPMLILLAGLWGAFSVRPADHIRIETDTRASASLRQSLRTLSLWVPLWLAPLFALSAMGATFLADIGWFFAKLAVVTFGGAYAVLAYMSQTVVAHHGWISTGQMIDALGLAETTPGPLILVTQFVAMLAGQLAAGPGLAIAAGLIALWATFVPCFLWIFLAAPYLESLTNHPRIGAALKSITAAVTGVILNLSLWFSINVLFDQTVLWQTGPLALELPVLASANPSAIIMAAVAVPIVLSGRVRLELVLIAMALAGLTLHIL